jgi:hypothetical protein
MVADCSKVSAMTNLVPNSCVQITCDCYFMWSLVQQYCYTRMATKTPIWKEYKLISNPAVRARRIAATYARFYLEMEEDGEKHKIGRFYWMALGAFASKTVACTFEYKRVKTQTLFTEKVKDGLAKGNLWLFCDIAGWHRYYTVHGNTFDHCMDSRNACLLVDELLESQKNIPWAQEVLPKIGNHVVTQEVKKGFCLVKEWEGAKKKNAKENIQFDHLMEIAKHEQLRILQPLIYNEKDPDSKDFVDWIKWQRDGIPSEEVSPKLKWVGVDRIPIKWASPTLKIVFGSACETDDEKLISYAPEGTKLEDYDSRMEWIKQVAKQFHKLMMNQTDYMHGELQAMAAWVDLPDCLMEITEGAKEIYSEGASRVKDVYFGNSK